MSKSIMNGKIQLLCKPCQNGKTADILDSISKNRNNKHLLISDNNFSGSLSDYKYKLEFIITPSYAAFDGELQNINFMLTADEFQPVKFKIKNKHDGKFEIFTGAVKTDGESLTLLETIVEKRISLTMKEGIYNKTNQVIYFNIIN